MQKNISVARKPKGAEAVFEIIEIMNMSNGQVNYREAGNPSAPPKSIAMTDFNKIFFPCQHKKSDCTQNKFFYCRVTVESVEPDGNVRFKRVRKDGDKISSGVMSSADFKKHFRASTIAPS